MSIEPCVADGTKLVLVYGVSAAVGCYSLKSLEDGSKTHALCRLAR